MIPIFNCHVTRNSESLELDYLALRGQVVDELLRRDVMRPIVWLE